MQSGHVFSRVKFNSESLFFFRLWQKILFFLDLGPTLGLMLLKFLSFELFVTLLRVPYMQSGHVRGVFWGKI